MQTAVQWLHDKFSNCKELKFEEIEQWLEEAKEMEKSQLIEAACSNPHKSNFDKIQGEMYYHIMYNL